MDSLKRWREPAVWVLLAAIVVNLVLALASLVLSPGSAGVFAYRASSPLIIIVLAVVVASCVLVDRTPHARLLTTLAMVIVGMAVLSTLVAALAALTFGGPVVAFDLLTLLVSLVVPALGLAVLIRVWTLPESAPVGPAALEPALPTPPGLPVAPDPQWQPTWSPDAAAGAVWRTAGDAASGAPASGWGAPGRWTSPARRR